MRALILAALLILTGQAANGEPVRTADIATCRNLDDIHAAYAACDDIINGKVAATKAETGIAFVQRGRMFLEWHHYGIARGEISQGRALIPTSDDASFWAGTAAEMDGDSEAAIYHFSKALSLNPDHAAARDNRAKLLWAAGDFAKAIAELDANIKRHPDHAPSLVRRAMIRTAFGDAGARADFDRADKLASDEFTSTCVRQLSATGTAGRRSAFCSAPLPRLRADQLADFCSRVVATDQSSAAAMKCRGDGGSDDHPGLSEETTFLQLEDGDKREFFEALIVRPVAATGRLPVALLTHGSTRDALTLRASNHRRQAHDLAYRGYLAVVLVRRGFGWSWSPDAPRPALVSCSTTAAQRAAEIDAHQLALALRALAGRADADPTRTVAIGVSAGGRAVLALAALNPEGLKAVVNVSGGVRRIVVAKDELACPMGPEMDATAALGAKTTVPSLWLFAENDSYFAPSFRQMMFDRYRAAGGPAIFRTTPSLAPHDGHTMFSHPIGRQDWLRAFDAFVADKDLPQPDTQAIDDLMRRYDFKPEAKEFLQAHFAMPTPKVFVIASTGLYSEAAISGDLATLERRVLEICRQDGGADCEVVLRNTQPASPAVGPM